MNTAHQIKRAPGRPPKPPGTKDIRLTVYVPPDLERDIAAFAEQHNLTMSEAMRTWLWKASTIASFPAGMPESSDAGGYFVTPGQSYLASFPAESITPGEPEKDTG